MLVTYLIIKYYNKNIKSYTYWHKYRDLRTEKKGNMNT